VSENRVTSRLALLRRIGYEGNNDNNDNNDDGIMRHDWREAAVVECEVPQATSSSGVDEGLRLVREEVKTTKHSSYTVGERHRGGWCCRLVIRDNDNADEGQSKGQGGEENGQFT
ncbi:hypothetical protein AMTR_s00051p00111380, partial [Amborella trichopoda]